MVLLDLQKAFDTVDHEILLMKLQVLGLDDLSIKWFRAYLSGRSQVVGVNGVLSSSRVIECGVPQGSILGPLLFLTYVNDMERAVDCKLLLYADDSALLVSGKSVTDIENQLSTELTKVKDWLVDNKLSLHLGKTESILFGSKKQIRKKSQMIISCGQTVIASTDSVRYLGSTMDQTLSGEDTFKSIVKLSNSRLKFLYRQAEFLNPATRRTLVTALVQCHFDYACSAWYYGLLKAQTSKLQICQNKLIRYVLGLGPRTHIGIGEFQKVGWLPIEQRVRQIGINHVFRIQHGLSAPYLQIGFTRVADTHSHNTRASAHGLVIPRLGSQGQKTFVYQGIKNWNTLPRHIQSMSTLVTFKSAVKKYLFISVQP